MATSRAISHTPLPLRVFLPPSLNIIFSFIPVQGDNVISVSIFGFPVIAPDIFSFFVVEKTIWKISKSSNLFITCILPNHIASFNSAEGFIYRYDSSGPFWAHKF